MKVTDENTRILGPDPMVLGTDPQIRIHTKMSRIHNIGSHQFFPDYLKFADNPSMSRIRNCSPVDPELLFRIHLSSKRIPDPQDCFPVVEAT